MSKSVGNVIAPQKIVASHGADVLRLWVAAEDYRDDVRARRYPGPEHTVFMKPEELERFKEMTGWKQKK